MSLLLPSTMFTTYFNTEAHTSTHFGTNDVEVDNCIPRPRWCPTRQQKQILESIFEWGTKTPSRNLIVQIAAHLNKYGNVGDANVFYWFQNRKARAKRKARAVNSHEANSDTIRFMKLPKSHANRKRQRRAAASNNRSLVNILNTKDVDHVIANQNAVALNPESSKDLSSSSTSTKDPPLSQSRYNNGINLAQAETLTTLVEMQRYVSPLHPQPSFLDEGYNHLPQGDNSTGEEMAYYWKGPQSSIPSGFTSNNTQAATSVDDVMLWDDMLAVALFTG